MHSKCHRDSEARPLSHSNFSSKLCTCRYTGRRGLYASVDLSHASSDFETIQHALVAQGLNRHTLTVEHHITVAQSSHSRVHPLALQQRLEQHLDRKPVDYELHLRSISYWAGSGGYGFLVADIGSRELHELHGVFNRLGVKHDFDSYAPHVTLARNVGTLTPKLISIVDRANLVLFNQRTFVKAFVADTLTCKDT